MLAFSMAMLSETDLVRQILSRLENELTHQVILLRKLR